MSIRDEYTACSFVPLLIPICLFFSKNSFLPSGPMTKRVSSFSMLTVDESNRDRYSARTSSSLKYSSSADGEAASSSTAAHEGEAVAWGRAEGRVIPSLRALSKMSHVQLEMSHVQLAASASHRPALSSSSLLFLAVGEVVLGVVVRRACRKGIRAIRAGGGRPGYLSRPPSSPWLLQPLLYRLLHPLPARWSPSHVCLVSDVRGP